MVKIAVVLEVAIKKYMLDRGLDVVDILNYEEDVYTGDRGGCDTCGWGAADPITVEVTYRDSEKKVRYWRYVGGFGEFIRDLEFLDTDYDELDSDPLSLS